MKRGTKIEVKRNAKYGGQDMPWTETYTGRKKIGRGGEWVTHHSHELIKSFQPKKICVHPASHSDSYFESNATRKEVVAKFHWQTYIYLIFLPQGTIVDTYSDDEYRFNLNSRFNIFYAGFKLERAGKEIFDRERGRRYSTVIKYSNAKRIKLR